MSGRDFEKSIQEKANELRLKPSPEVWERVAAQIREKRRRRGFFWFMMAASIVAGSLSFWFLAPTGFDRLSTRDQLTAAGKPPAKAAESTGFTGKQAAGDPQHDLNQAEPASPLYKGNPLPLSKPGQGSEIKEADKVKMKEESPAGPQLQHPAGKSHTEGKSLPAGKNHHENKSHPEGKSYTAGKSHPEGNIREKERPFGAETGQMQDGQSCRQHPASDVRLRENYMQDELGSNPKIANKIPDQAANIQNPEAPTSRALIAGNLPVLTFSRPGIAVKDSDKTQGDRKLADSLLSTTQNPAKKNKWTTSIQAGAGWSSLQNGFFQNNKSAVNEFQNSIALPPANVAGGGMQRSPSDVKAGPSFQIGFSLNRATGKKTSVGLGIQYAYQSNRIRIGQSIDSASVLENGRLQTFTSGNAYTGAGNQGTVYHNAYHYLQIPFEFSYNPDNRKKLFWNTGLTISYLIQTDALSYNETAGLYYKDKARFNSWMAAAQTGLYYRFRATGNWQISAGPFLQYQLNPLDKTGSGTRLLFTGLGLRLYPNIKMRD